MKILYGLNSKDPGGMEQHVLDLVTQMITRGHEVFVWCEGGVIYDWYKKAGAKVTERTIRNDIDLGYIKDLKIFLQEYKIEVVHAHELKAVVNTIAAGFLAGVKIRISHQHTPFISWQVPKSKRLIYDLFYSILINLMGSKEIALTQSIKKAKIRAGILARKLAVIPNGVDTYKFFVSENERVIYRREVCRKYHIDSSTKIIGNLSRTTKEKGHDLLLKAFAKLVEDKKIAREEFTLLICGGGELESSLWDLAGSLGVKDRVVITGCFDDDMKIKFYNTFNYFVFPTLAEGFGIVLIEALITGLPVLCSDLEVLREVGENYPMYFETGNFEDLSQKMLDFVGLSQDDSKVGQINHVKNKYSMEKFGENYDNLYRSLV
ncbi:MAG: glycosyltransferase family 4 protein [Patescibacteria group bacterium]